MSAAYGDPMSPGMAALLASFVAERASRMEECRAWGAALKLDSYEAHAATARGSMLRYADELLDAGSQIDSVATLIAMGRAAGRMTAREEIRINQRSSRKEMRALRRRVA